jgi:hypothetical protein
MERDGEADHARMARFRDLAMLAVYGDLSGTGTPSGERSPLGDGDGEKSFPANVLGDRNGEILVPRGSKRSGDPRRG